MRSRCDGREARPTAESKSPQKKCARSGTVLRVLLKTTWKTLGIGNIFSGLENQQALPQINMFFFPGRDTLVTVSIKNLNSVGKCHGNCPSFPIPKFLHAAAMSLIGILTSVFALITKRRRDHDCSTNSEMTSRYYNYIQRQTGIKSMTSLFRAAYKKSEIVSPWPLWNRQDKNIYRICRIQFLRV